jgi:hypothetical protein
MWAELDPAIEYFRPAWPQLFDELLRLIEIGMNAEDAFDRLGAIRQALLIVLTGSLHHTAAIETPLDIEAMEATRAGLDAAKELLEMLIGEYEKIRSEIDAARTGAEPDETCTNKGEDHGP